MRSGNAKVTRYRQAASQFEGQLARACAGQFDQQRDEILRNLDTSRIGKSYTRKDWLQDLIDWAAATESFKDAIQPTIQAVLIQAGQDAIQAAGQQPSTFDPFTPSLIEYFQSRSLKIAQDVNDETAKQIRAALSQGVLDGKTTNELRADVQRIMGSASTMRADRIARTEVTRAQGYADIQAWDQSGVVTAKEWFTAEDEHVCPFCESLDHKVYDLHEDVFSKGDSLTIDGQTQQYNYDDVPSPPLHVSCRCVLLPVRN